MIEYLKAIYNIVVANNKFLVALEQRIMTIEHSLHFEDGEAPILEESEVTEPNNM